MSSYASGLQSPQWPADKPLALNIAHYIPVREGHPPPGTVPDDIVPEGREKPKLFTSVQFPVTKSITLKNRIVVSPMCQYSSHDGFVTPYHLAHLGSFALHGAGTIMIEACGVTPQGRITPQDCGLYKDEHVPAFTSLISSLKSFTADLCVGVQLAHAGRKASTWSPFHRGEKQVKDYVTKEEGGWPDEVIAPSALSYGPGWIVPKEMTIEDIQQMKKYFVQAAQRAFKAGCDFVELHVAHGYLLHSFISPLSNTRTDKYGGSFENRIRIVLEIVQDIKKEFSDKSVWIRVSSTDYAEHVLAEGKESWEEEQTKRFAKELTKVGVDVLDCSAGGLVHFQKITPKPAYQLPYASGVSSLKLPNLLVGSVGMLEGDEFAGQVAERALQNNDAQLVFLARGLLANPKWPEEAAVELMGTRCAGTPQYHRVHPSKPGVSSKPPPTAQNNN
ncbi:hypothetical protein CBS101457_004379 [Exobasidium rhododendri]|nr:hypothetical protein CBS101457_004379 [Exobasidium rhododendri]